MKILFYCLLSGLLLINACKPPSDKNEAQPQETPPLETQAQSGTAVATPDNIQWQSFDKGLEASKKQNKFVFVEFYADWCPYCKKLHNNVLPDPQIQKHLKTHFIPIRVNGDSENKVVYKGKTVTEKDLTAIHQVRGYPTMLFMEPNGEIIGAIPGFVPADDLRNMLAFITSKSYKKMDFKEYMKKQG